ncbi:hypothetical protein C8Q76DRAFT_407766 [Earliella scabrosa]|nr:hypothetical protein C8Q76DRAFT_407766 [Earliella scabrosa]
MPAMQHCNNLERIAKVHCAITVCLIFVCLCRTYALFRGYPASEVSLRCLRFRVGCQSRRDT